jgi:hypothetical protein
MHYSFKQKFNVLDGQANRSLKIQEIDVILNNAQDVFIKAIAMPRSGVPAFESTQRTIDDIRTIVKDGIVLAVNKIDDYTYATALPSDYMYNASGNKVKCTKGNCIDYCNLFIKQHNDRFESSPFDKSNFEWREVNLVYTSTGMKMFSDGTFILDEVVINYIKIPRYMHNAQDTTNHQYTDLKGNVLTGTVDCELPASSHSDIVDLAVLIATGNLNLNSYNIKKAQAELTT